MKKQSRRSFFRKVGSGLYALPALNDISFISPVTDLFAGAETPVYFTTGYKVMEVQTTSAIVWTRLCGQEMPNPIRHARREEVFRHPLDFDEDQPVAKMDGGVIGRVGIVRITLKNKNQKSVSQWLEAREANDFTVRAHFGKLRADTLYRVEIEGKSPSGGMSSTIAGTFRTMPEATKASPVNLVTSTCQYFWSYDNDQRGFKSYDSIKRLNPDFFIHTGDYVYYDKPGPLGTTLEKARHQWHAMDSWKSIRELYEHVPVYMIKDDHDLLKDDAYPGMPPYGQLSYEEGLKIWRENVPLNDKPYRTIRWGKDLQVWMVEGREFRSPNTLDDGPEKTIWGTEQKRWFTETVEASDATFKLLFTATPVVGPDRLSKKDNHANAVFQTEGNWLRKFLSTQPRMYVVNGDRHWQYVSKDKETGVMEFGSGPVSDYHAQGWDASDKRPEHRFLRLKGGFLNIRVARQSRQPSIEFIHCDVNGVEVHRVRFTA